MNREVVTASPDETLFSAIRKMCHNTVSCVAVVEGTTVVGILTQKDVLIGIANQRRDCWQLRVAQCMSQPVEAIGPDLPVLDASKIMESKGIKRLPVLANRRLVGIVTQTDITRGLVCLCPLQQISEIMSTSIATVDITATVAEAARVMCRRDISCVVVMHGHEAIGVLTQKDVLRRVMAFRDDPNKVHVNDVMSSPVLIMPSSFSVFTASRAMDTMRIHRLVVKDGSHVRGIVSQTDIMKAIARKLQDDEEKRRQLSASSEIPMYMVDLNGMVTYVNSAFVRLFELSHYQDVLGQPFLAERFWPDPADRERFLKDLNKDNAQKIELTLRTAAGRKVHVALFTTVTRNARGKIDGRQGVLWDMTDEKRKGRNTANNNQGRPTAQAESIN
jgi:PAS domain S-box-containing protein